MHYAHEGLHISFYIFLPQAIENLRSSLHPLFIIITSFPLSLNYMLLDSLTLYVMDDTIALNLHALTYCIRLE